MHYSFFKSIFSQTLQLVVKTKNGILVDRLLKHSGNLLDRAKDRRTRDGGETDW